MSRSLRRELNFKPLEVEVLALRLEGLGLSSYSYERIRNVWRHGS